LELNHPYFIFRSFKMGINTNANSGNAINVSFNSILGSLYLGADRAIVDAVMAKAPKGASFTGNSGFTAEARKAIREQKVHLVTSVNGILRDARLRIIESEGKEYPYLNIRLQDGADTIFVSLNLSTNGAQVLARKLLNAEPNVETVLNVFSTIEPKRDGADRAYANTNAYLKQEGVEIKAQSAVDSFVPEVEAVIKKLRDAGVDDSAILNQKRRLVATAWHEAFLEQVAAKFAAARPASAEHVEENHEEHLESNPSNFDGFDDDIPF
jgi:hypothetical protein